MRNGGQCVVSVPKIVMRPSRGGVSPIRLRNVVVLPAPLRPSSAVILPSATSQADAMQDVALAVKGVQPFGSECGASCGLAQVGGLHGIVGGDFLSACPRRASGPGRAR